MPSLIAASKISEGWAFGDATPTGQPSAGSMPSSGPVAIKVDFNPEAGHDSTYRALMSVVGATFGILIADTNTMMAQGLGGARFIAQSPDLDTSNTVVVFWRNGDSIRIWLNGTLGGGGVIDFPCSGNDITGTYFEGCEGLDESENPITPWYGTYGTFSIYASDFTEAQLAYLVNSAGYSVSETQKITVSGQYGTWKCHTSSSDILNAHDSAANVKAAIDTHYGTNVTVTRNVISTEVCEFTIAFNTGGVQTLLAPVDINLSTEVGPKVNLSLSPSSVSENVSTATVTATLDTTASENVIVALSISGTATKDTHYSMSSTSILVTSGSLTGSVNVGTFDNTVYEPSKTAIFDISSVTGGSATENGTQQVTLTITSNDPQPTVNLTRTPATIAENGGTGYITAILSNLSVDNVIIDFTASGAVLNTDYTLSSNSLIVSAGNTSGSISITALSDTLAEGDQTVIFDFSVTNGIKGSTTSITIVDDDPLITLDSDISSFHEVNNVATIFAYSSFTKASNITVNLVFTGTATDVDDYSRSGSSITISSGSTSGSMQIVALVDAVSDPDETIIISIDTVTNAVEDGTQSLTLTILEPSETTAPTTQPGLGYKIGLGL